MVSRYHAALLSFTDDGVLSYLPYAVYVYSGSAEGNQLFCDLLAIVKDVITAISNRKFKT